MFRHLYNSLPSRFNPLVTQIQGIVLMLRSSEHSAVFTLGYLSKMKILIDPESAEITGIVEWAEASFPPLGFALYALDGALGSIGPDRWKCLNNADYPRDQF